MTSQEGLDVQDLLRQLRESTLKQQQAEDRAKHAEDRAEEERTLRKQAEERNQATSFPEYLLACHKHLHCTMTIQTDPTQSTQGGTTKPDERVRPVLLSPWLHFLKTQNDTWDEIYQFHIKAEFPRAFLSEIAVEAIGLDHAQRPIASEDDLRNIQRYTVETRVSDIVKHLKKLPGAIEQFNLGDDLTFENHTNTLSERNEEVAEELAMEERNLVNPNLRTPPFDLRIDQLCVNTTSEGVKSLVFIAEYKPPHKLTIATVRRGLEVLSRTTFEAVVNRLTKPSKGDVDGLFEYHSEKLVATVITQTFAYMIHGGVEYAYITTGEAFIFLRVLEKDPTKVFYHLAEPTAEVLENPDAPLRNTAISQVLAFTLRALQSKRRSQGWIAAAKRMLHTWTFDGIAALQSIPNTIKKDCKGSRVQTSEPS